MNSENQTIEEVLCGLCKKQCGAEVSVEEELLESGKLSSFQLLELICDMEENFGILLAPEEIREVSNFASVKAMARLIKLRYSLR